MYPDLDGGCGAHCRRLGGSPECGVWVPKKTPDADTYSDVTRLLRGLWNVPSFDQANSTSLLPQQAAYDSPLPSPPARLRVHRRGELEFKVTALTSDVTCFQWQSIVLQPCQIYRSSTHQHCLSHLVASMTQLETVYCILACKLSTYLLTPFVAIPATRACFRLLGPSASQCFFGTQTVHIGHIALAPKFNRLQ